MLTALVRITSPHTSRQFANKPLWTASGGRSEDSVGIAYAVPLKASAPIALLAGDRGACQGPRRDRTSGRQEQVRH